MFFGLKISDNQNDAGVTTFHNNVKLSQAVLEPNSKGAKKDQPLSIMVEIDNEHYCLCVLQPGQIWQCPLDLLMEADTQVKFYLKGGSGTVHITGYESPEFDMDDDSSDDEDMPEYEDDDSSDVSDIEIDSDSRVRVAKIPVSKQNANSKPTPTKANVSVESASKATNGKAKLNKRQVAALNKLGEQIDDDETDSDDDDFDILNPDDEDDSDDDGEKDSDDDDDDDDDGDDDDSDEEMSDEDMDDDSEDEF